MFLKPREYGDLAKFERTLGALSRLAIFNRTGVIGGS